MLENLLTLGAKKAANFFDPSILLKKVGILQLGTSLWVVAHEVLGEENARVKACTDARVNFVRALLVRETVTLTRKQFDAGQEDRVECASKVDIIVLFGAGVLDDLLLQTQQVLDIPSLEVLSEELRLVVKTGAIFRTLRFLFFNHDYFY